MRSWSAAVFVAVALLLVSRGKAQLVLHGQCGDFDEYEQFEQPFFKDGGLNSIALLRRYIGLNVSDPVLDAGIICDDTAPDLPQTADEAAFIQRCAEVVNDTTVTRPATSDRFLVSQVGTLGSLIGYSLAFRFLGYVPNGKFSHLRFWYAQSEIAAVSGFLVALVAEPGVFPVQVVSSFSLNSTTCPGTGAWNAFDLPLQAMDDFLNARAGTATFVGVQVFLQEIVNTSATLPFGDDGYRSHAVDNIELVNLNATNDRIDPAAGINRLEQFGFFDNVECEQLSDLLQVDIFALSSFGLIGFCLLVFFVAACLHTPAPSLSHVADVLWFVVSLSLAILAVVELEEFTRQLEELDSCTNEANAAFENATEFLNPIELKSLFDFDSSSFFGTFRISLPPYNSEILEQLFFSDTSCTSNIDANGDLFQTLCSAPNGSEPELACTTDKDVFLAETFTANFSQGLTGIYSLYGEVGITQDHWIPFIIAAFGVDIALSVIHLILRGLFRILVSRERWRAKLTLYANVVSVMISTAFTAYILSVALLEPVQFNGQFVLRRDIGRSNGGTYDSSLGIFVCPELVVTDGIKLQLDLGGVTQINNPFSNLANLQQNLLEQKLAIAREISPTGKDTVNTACPLDNVVIESLGDGSSQYSIACVPNIRIPLLPEKGAEDRLSFVVYNVIIGLVLVDFLITLTDVVALILLFRVLAKAGIVDVALSARRLRKS